MDNLIIERYEIEVNGEKKLLGKIIAKDGYCFYDASIKIENEEGNIVPEEEVLPEQRLYMKQRTLPIVDAKLTNEELSERFVCVPIDDRYEIV